MQINLIGAKPDDEEDFRRAVEAILPHWDETVKAVEECKLTLSELYLTCLISNGESEVFLWRIVPTDTEKSVNIVLGLWGDADDDFWQKAESQVRAMLSTPTKGMMRCTTLCLPGDAGEEGPFIASVRLSLYGGAVS
jgi:hypothetical protein